jgi:hypothetical protein
MSVLALMALPAAAQADPVTDCVRDDVLNKNYSNSELRKTLDELPTDADEYGNCREVIQNAITNPSDKGGNRPGGGTGAAGSSDPSLPPDEQGARAQDDADLNAITGGSAKDRPAPSVDIGGEKVEPGENGLFDLASASNDLPLPLLVALIALGVLALTGALLALRKHVPVLARVPLLSKIPTPRVPFLGRFRR